MSSSALPSTSSDAPFPAELSEEAPLDPPEHPTDPAYLEETPILNYRHARVQAFIRQTVADDDDTTTKAVKLYYAVRDSIWYDPYGPFYRPDHYQASFVLARGRGFCINKAALLCAVGRAVGIPSRMGFATVRNHLATRQLLERIGTNLFVFHGYTDFYLNGGWVKATPAFNRELCLRHDVIPLEFDGRTDALFQSYNLKQQRFMEYVTFHGIYTDVPVNAILKAWRDIYGVERVDGWIEEMQKNSPAGQRDFYREE